ncbi:MAG: 3'-5' exonuclease [Pseudomonadota bacterium]
MRASLRLRVFLFFVLLAVGALACGAGALALGWARAEPGLPAGPFVTAFVVFSLLNTGLLLGIWLLFDENVAKPINRLSANLRLRAHGGKVEILDTTDAQYLGDLAPAAAALSAKVGSDVEAMASSVARETERLSVEHQRLAALLSESPVGTILLNPAREIVLYDAQAAGILSAIRPPRLKAALTDYFYAEDLEAGLSEARCKLRPVTGAPAIEARVKPLHGDGLMLFFDPPHAATPDAIAARPLTFDFDLMQHNDDRAMADQPLEQLCFVVFDLETTGLSVAQDAIVQIGAVRVVNGARVAGEEYHSYVNPERPIPPASTRIHHVSDAHVATAPTIAQAGQALHDFARGAVLVAHNAPFDMGFLKRHEAEIGAAWDHSVLDTVLLSAVAFGTTEEHSLDALCARLGIEIAAEERHTALGDARVTAEALVRVLQMLRGQGYDSLAALKGPLEQQARRLYKKNV